MTGQTAPCPFYDAFPRGAASTPFVPVWAPRAHVDSSVDQPMQKVRTIAVFLSDKCYVELNGCIMGLVNVRIGRFLTINWIGTQAAIIGQAEFLRDKAKIIGGRYFRHVVELVRRVAVP